MRRLLLALALSCVAASVDAAPWTGILDASRAIDWTGAGVSGGIPVRTVVCATLNPGATAAQITSALASCPSNQVVYLTAGTYNLSAGIVFPTTGNISLRGAGPHLTFLVFSGSNTCQGFASALCVSTDGSSPLGGGTFANWTAGFSAGATSITLSTTAGLAIGDLLNLQQLDDSDTDNGQLWVNSTIDVSSIEGTSGTTIHNRDQGQWVTVTNISGSTVTFSPGLYMPNWALAKSPQAWWPGSSVKRVGIESLSIDGANSGGNNNIVIMDALNSWVQNVRSLNTPGRAHVLIYASARVTVRDSYIFGGPGASSNSYGIETDLVSDLLIENNISQYVNSPFTMGIQASGCVVAYNYSINDILVGTPAWMTSSLYHHAVAHQFVLFEGNDGPGFYADAIHGTSHFGTAFRNRMEGNDAGQRTLNTIAYHISAYNRYFNAIGNVVGLSGYHTTYECTNATTTDSCGGNPELVVYMLGFSGRNNYTAPVLNDALVKTTLMRWGNYDTVTGTSRFVSGEVPSGLGIYANPVPASQVLPSSFYLASKPPFWGSTITYPAIGPDVTGGNIANLSGHAYKIPARVCYESVMGGVFASGALTFNAAACYADPQPGAANPVRLEGAGSIGGRVTIQ